jgi:hypothetical protein
MNRADFLSAAYAYADFRCNEECSEFPLYSGWEALVEYKAQQDIYAFEVWAENGYERYLDYHASLQQEIDDHFYGRIN